MRKIILKLILLTTIISSISCKINSNPPVVLKSRPLDESSTYHEKEITTIPGWITEGVEGYGIIVSMVQDKFRSQPVKCRVVRVKGTEIKLRFMESTTLVNSIKCTQRVQKGGTYWEKEGDFWRTKEEVLQYIKAKGWSIN